MSSTVNVYDTISGKYINVEVSEEIAAAYNRTGWNIKDNNKSFYDHEIQFSALIGGKDNAFENFKEFISEYNLVDEAAHKVLVERLYDCLNFLPKNERELIQMLYFENMTERECAERLCTTQQNVHKKKHRVLCKLHKLLK